MDWAGDGADLIHALAGSVAEQRRDLMTDTSLAHRDYGNARLVDVEDLFNDLATQSSSIWSDEQYAVAQANTTRQTIANNELHLLEGDRATADYDHALRQADAAQTLAQQLALTAADHARQSIGDAREQALQQLALAAAGGNQGGYAPWHTATAEGLAPTPVNTISTAALSLPAASATHAGYFDAATAGMFTVGPSGFVPTGMGPFQPITVEQAALPGRLWDQAWILDHGTSPSPVTAGTQSPPPAELWELLETTLSTVAQVGLATVQNQYAWAGFAGGAAAAGIQALAAAASTVAIAIPYQPVDLEARPDSQATIQKLIDLLEKHGLNRDSGGVKFKANQLADELQASLDAQKDSGKSLIVQVIDTVRGNNLNPNNFGEGYVIEFAKQLEKLRTKLAREQFQRGVNEVDAILDKLQSDLELAGLLLPGLGDGGDLLNAGISLLRGDWKAAAGHGFAAIPIVGMAVTGRKLLKAAKTTEATNSVAKGGKNAVQAGDEMAKEVGRAAKQAGPGKLVNVFENMSERASKYQKQITGNSAGKAYLVNGVKFDGYDKGSLVKVLIDAKGEGYVKLMKDPFQRLELASKLEKQARAQLNAAKATKTPIRWVVAEQEFAEGLKNLFASRKINIEVIFVPPAP